MVGTSNESVPEIAIDQKKSKEYPKVDHFAARYGERNDQFQGWGSMIRL